jgi:hypothetical protein
MIIVSSFARYCYRMMIIVPSFSFPHLRSFVRYQMVEERFIHIIYPQCMLSFCILRWQYIKHFNTVVLPTQLDCSIQYIQYHHDSNV